MPATRGMVTPAAAGRAGLVAEAVEGFVVEEELADREFAAVILLPLQVAEIAFETGRLHVLLGVEGAADMQAGEIGLALDEGDEVAGMGEAVGMGLEGAVALGRIPAQGEHVADARGRQGGEDFPDFRFGMAHAGEVGHGFDSQLALDPGDQVHGLGAGGTSRAVGDGDEVGGQPGDFPQGGVQGTPSGRVLGREELVGKGGDALPQLFVEAHGGREF
jgi:hypothetical protein